MRQSWIAIGVMTVTAAVFAGQPEWPQWRGPANNGVAEGATPPTRWSEETVAWKTPIPGFGLSTPVVVGNRVFLLTAEETRQEADTSSLEQKQRQLPGWRKRLVRSAKRKHAFRVLCVDRTNGEMLWNTAVREELPNEPVHSDSSWASASPVTDGKHLWAFFGSHGLYCLDMEGNVVWEKDLGRMTTKAHFGEGASPALHGNVLVVNWDHEGDSFLMAMDKRTGKQIWKKSREEVTSWSSPVIIDVDGRPQVVINATGKSRGYDLATGEVLWQLGGMTANVIPSPVYAAGRLYLASGFRGAALQCIDPTKATGDLAGSDALLWTVDKKTPYVPSVVCYDGVVYYGNFTEPEISACDAATGEVFFGPEEIEPLDAIYASPLAADGKVYVVGRTGHTAVLQHGRSLKVLSINRLDDRFDASPVAIGNELLLRGHRHLYCIRQDAPREQAEVPYPWQRVLVAGYGLGKIEIMNRSGEVEWTYADRVQVCDVWMLDDGRIVYSGRNQGVKMIQPDLETGQGGKLIWHYKIPQDAETHSCQPLANGRFLIGISQDGVSHVVEVDTEGKEHARVEVAGRGDDHKTFRVIRKTLRGTYLINVQGKGYRGRRAVEIDAEGNILRQFEGGAFVAVPLPGGNVLLSSGDERTGADKRRIMEVDPEGNVVWQVLRQELEDQGVVIGYAAGVQRLPNGNTLICNWNGHRNARGPAFFEVTPDKKVVWRAPADYPGRVTSVMVLDEAYRDRPSR